MAKGKKTGGRQKGSRNRATVEKENFTMKVVSKAVSDGIMPLDVMLDNMRFAYSQAGQLIASMVDGTPTPQEFKELIRLRAMAQSFAADAAPYLHPKLSSVEHKGDPDNPLETVTRIELTTPEGHNGSHRAPAQAPAGIFRPS